MSKVNYEDERFQKVESQKTDALSDLEQTYTDMIDKSDKYYQDQINASKEYADTQTQLQKEQLEHTTNKIEQQKEQAHKDYLKEQSGAYYDWWKQSNEYGTEAEKMAAAGLENTGFSETSQVSMYTAYQNRVAVARESYSNAVLNYDNAIKDAQLQNSSILAEIAYNALQQQLELSLQGFQYKNQLILDKTNKKLEVDQMYYSRWQDVLNQINTENALKEQQRQANLAHSRATAQLEEEKRQFDLQYQQQQAKINKTGSSDYVSNRGVPTANQLIDKVKSGQTNKSSDIVVVGSPLTAEGAAEKIVSGELIVTKQEGNRVWVARNPNYVKGQSTLDKYTWLK